MTDHFKTVIVGAGLAGIGMGIRLKDEGETSFVILEKEARAGGVWRDNTYPGAACDVQSHLYWFSFDDQPDWSRIYPLQPEILANIERLVQRHGLLPSIRFNAELSRAAWDDDARLWRLTLADGSSIDAETLITAWGQLNTPSTGGIRGVEDFAGDWFHSARWNHDLPLEGRRVASIGSGPSAAQFIPELAKVAGHLTVFQRSPNYVLPRQDRAYTPEERQAFLDDPSLMYANREGYYRDHEGSAQCARWRVPLTVRGGGTGNYGQAVPLQGGVVLEMTAMDRVVSLEDGLLTAEPGCKLIDIDAATRPQGWELRMHPSTKRTATLGGFIGGGSGGIGSITWGGLRDRGNVVSARVVSCEPHPRVVTLHGDAVSGINHAYGTTGIITQLTIGMAPAQPWMDLAAGFPDFAAAARFGLALGQADGIAKKLVTAVEAPLPDYFRGLDLPPGAHVVLAIVARHGLTRLGRSATRAWRSGTAPRCGGRAAPNPLADLRIYLEPHDAARATRG